MKKRVISLFLAIIMCLMLNVSALAADSIIVVDDFITLAGTEYHQIIEQESHYTISTLENADKLYKSVYDSQSEIINIYVTDKNFSARSAEDTPYLSIDLNYISNLPEPSVPLRSCETLYYSTFMGKYYMYTKWDDGSYELLNDRNQIAFTPAGTISQMARKCEAYYTYIRYLDRDGPDAIDTAVNTAISNAYGQIPLWNEINSVCAIMVNAANGQDSTSEWLSLITSAISALPGLKYFGLIMDIGNVALRFGVVAEDIFHLNDIYKTVFNYYN